MDCSFGQTLDEAGECVACKANGVTCDNGCIRPDDCGLCADHLCDTCTEWDSDCTTCIANAEPNSATKDCECNPSYVE
jgi:hypothetical protein